MRVLHFTLDIVSLMGAVADHRYPRRRLDRRPREHHPPPRSRRSARRCGDHRARRDRRRRRRDHAGRRRRLPADRVPVGDRRQVHERVRRRRRRRDAVLAVRLVHAHADARRALVGRQAAQTPRRSAGLVPERLRALDRAGTAAARCRTRCATAGKRQPLCLALRAGERAGAARVRVDPIGIRPVGPAPARSR